MEEIKRKVYIIIEKVKNKNKIKYFVGNFQTAKVMCNQLNYDSASDRFSIIIRELI